MFHGACKCQAPVAFLPLRCLPVLSRTPNHGIDSVRSDSATVDASLGELSPCQEWSPATLLRLVRWRLHLLERGVSVLKLSCISHVLSGVRVKRSVDLLLIDLQIGAVNEWDGCGSSTGRHRQGKRIFRVMDTQVLFRQGAGCGGARAWRGDGQVADSVVRGSGDCGSVVYWNHRKGKGHTYMHKDKGHT